MGGKVNKDEFKAHRRRIKPFVSAELFINGRYGIGEIVDYVSFIPFSRGFTPYDLECSNHSHYSINIPNGSKFNLYFGLIPAENLCVCETSGTAHQVTANER